MKRSMLIAGVAFFLSSLLLGMVLALPDEALFGDLYRKTPVLAARAAWQPLLLGKFLYGLGVGVIYGWARPRMVGPAWRCGALVGLATWPLGVATFLELGSRIPVPAVLWGWWCVYALIVSVLCGMIAGNVAERFGHTRD